MVRRCIYAEIGGPTVWRWLHEDAIKPWQHRGWILPRDPDFEHKAGRVLDLCHGMWEGMPSGADEYVISADEKTSSQARIRSHVTLPPKPGKSMRVEHAHKRGGSLSYPAAWDVHQARVFGRYKPQSGIAAFDRLVDEVILLLHICRCNGRMIFRIDTNKSLRQSNGSLLELICRGCSKDLPIMIQLLLVQHEETFMNLQKGPHSP